MTNYNPFRYADLSDPKYRPKLADVRLLSRAFDELDERNARLVKDRDNLETMIDVILDIAHTNGVTITRTLAEYEVARINWNIHPWYDVFKAKPEFPPFETWLAARSKEDTQY